VAGKYPLFHGIGKRLSKWSWPDSCLSLRFILVCAADIFNLFWEGTPLSLVLCFELLSPELYYIYTSVWGHNSYTLWGILALVFVILIIVTACITIALTYFQLSMEDYRWWWRSFFSGGSTGLFIFVHSFFYYAYR